MKISFALGVAIVLGCSSAQLYAQTTQKDAAPTHLYIDVHQLQPGKVTDKDVAAAHAKDLAVEGKYGVKFLNYWVDQDKGLVYCLSEARDSADVIKTHKEAHGLLPAYVSEVHQGVKQ